MLKQLQEPFVFGCVGIAASAAHFFAAIFFVEFQALEIWIANLIGFLAAFPVSYLGHAYLTFKAQRYGRESSVTRQSMRRFLSTAMLGFTLNQSSVVIFADWLALPFRPVLFVTIISVAVLLYMLSKFWAFNETAKSRNRSNRRVGWH